MINNFAGKSMALVDIEKTQELFGSYDENLKIIENELLVSILIREDELRIIGEDKNIDRARRVLEILMKKQDDREEINSQIVSYIIALVKEEDGVGKQTYDFDDVVITTARGKVIKCKTLGQKDYINSIKQNDIVFGIGPAGTGKTYLAMAMAIKAFKNREVNRIILTRPAVEAGEKLGFLPGDLQEKVDPYLRPLYDALHDIMGIEVFQKNMEKGLIEVAPLAYMRGRTLNDSYIILDEAQNTTPEQMKMFLTRLGFGSKVIVTGDITQIDLPRGRASGLKTVMGILEGIKGVDFIYFNEKDVVRHKLVQDIIKAYERYEINKEDLNDFSE
ncbi:MAG: phoH [Clostridia bacterium]|nr:phoH [Clostridia bacterium]